jgi:hypothetical protein
LKCVRLASAQVLVLLLIPACAACFLGAPAAQGTSKQQQVQQQVQQQRQQPIPVAFEGSAFLITYYSGVAGVLMERGVIKPGVSHLSGLSGGALTAVLTALGFDGAQQREFFVSAVAECVERWGSCKGHINEVLRERLADCLPDDAASKGEDGLAAAVLGAPLLLQVRAPECVRYVLRMWKVDPGLM